MRSREFPVLSGDDRAFIDRLAVGLGDSAARVFAYLLLRANSTSWGNEPATQLMIRVGTDMNRKAVTDALTRLEERELVEATTISDETRGRPPRAWQPIPDRPAAVSRVDEQHAQALVSQAVAVHQAGVLYPDVVQSTPDADAAIGKTLMLGLNWHPNGLQLPFFAATATGAYENWGLDVTFEEYEGSLRALNAVAVGDADVGVAGAATVLRACQSGTPVLPVALLYQRAMAVLYTTRDAFGEPFDRVDQLRGRRLGMPAESETGLLGRLFLSQTDLLGDIDLVTLEGEETEALLAGDVDVITGSFADPGQVSNAGFTVDALLIADRFPLLGPALIAHREAVLRGDDALVAFLAGTTTGWATARQQPAEAARAVSHVSGHSAERERRTFEQAADEFGMSDISQSHGWGWQDVDGWERLRTALSQASLCQGASS